MTVDEAKAQLAKSVQAIKEADDKAERGALAFLLGRFPAYWQAEHGTIGQLRQRYEELGGDAGAVQP